MRKKLFLLSLLIGVVGLTFYLKSESSEAEKLRKKHESFLENSPFKETQRLTRKERKEMGLPPNAYNEQMWELTMDPSTGRPMPRE